MNLGPHYMGTGQGAARSGTRNAPGNRHRDEARSLGGRAGRACRTQARRVPLCAVGLRGEPERCAVRLRSPHDAERKGRGGTGVVLSVRPAGPGAGVGEGGPV